MNIRCAGVVFATAVLFVSSTAMATVVVDGVFDRTNEWNGSYTSGDYVAANGRVGPGWGGQAYDIEHIGTTFSADSLFFGIQAGYNFADPPSSVWLPGDIALNVDDDDFFEYAIDFSIEGTAITYSLIDMTAAGSVWDAPYFTQSGPWQAGAYENILATWTHELAFGSGHYSEIQRPGETDMSYVLEGMLDLSLLDLYTGGDITIHWTMGCGNDVLEHTEAAPVPEPATMLLFGAGLMGMASSAMKKRRKNSKDL